MDDRSEFLEQSATVQAAAIARRTISARELLDLHVQQLNAVNPTIHAVARLSDWRRRMFLVSVFLWRSGQGRVLREA